MADGKEIIGQMLNALRLYFESTRHHLGGKPTAQPRQAPVLGMLLCHEGMSQADLARELHITPATVAVSVARLERLGLVAREKNVSNQRANVLSLTPMGREEAGRMQTALEAVRDVALQDFSEQELAQMESYCRRMCDNLHSRYGTGEERKRSCGKCSDI